jgi:hypothetical protein
MRRKLARLAATASLSPAESAAIRNCSPLDSGITEPAGRPVLGVGVSRYLVPDLLQSGFVGEAPVIAAITQLLQAGQRDGTIRADADPGDFLQLTGALWRAASGPEDRSQPMLGLILDGLSTRQRR